MSSSSLRVPPARVSGPLVGISPSAKPKKSANSTQLRSSRGYISRKRSRLKKLALCILTLALATAGMTSAQTVINFPSGFASAPSTIWLENNAAYSGSSIHLVPATVHNASNAWFKTPENIQAFTNTFTFHINCSAQPGNCGDGIGWMLVCACSGGNPVYDPGNGKPGYTYSGFSGGQFSWSQCEQPLRPALSYCWDTNGNTGSGLKQLPNSVLVKLDMYNNVGIGGPAPGYTGLFIGGNYPQAPYEPQYDMSGAGINLQNGDEFTGTISYNGALLTETITDQSTSATYTRSYLVDLPYAIAGNTSFIGYGGGTGVALQDAYIDSWVYTVNSSGCGYADILRCIWHVFHSSDCHNHRRNSQLHYLH
jgi:hypothetical protein